MIFKKNAVSYGIWALYLMVVGIVLSFLGMVVGGQGSGIPYMALILLALAFGSLALVYFLAKKIIDNVKIKKMASAKAALVEGILVAVLMVTGILLRILMIGGAGEEAAYYQHRAFFLPFQRGQTQKRDCQSETHDIRIPGKSHQYAAYRSQYPGKSLAAAAGSPVKILRNDQKDQRIYTEIQRVLFACWCSWTAL